MTCSGAHTHTSNQNYIEFHANNTIEREISTGLARCLSPSSIRFDIHFFSYVWNILDEVQRVETFRQPAKIFPKSRMHTALCDCVRGKQMYVSHNQEHNTGSI